MPSFVPIFFAGFAAGAVHVFSGPDHLSAIAPLALAQKKRSWFLGVRWGLGHSSGVIIVAALATYLRELISVEFFSAKAERVVGVMLIGIGIWGFRRAFGLKLHFHKHLHGGDAHLHLHAHGRGHIHTQPHVHVHASLWVGVLHGLAGGSHFLGVLPALALPTQWASGVYLVAFGIGTVMAMALFAHFFGAVGTRVGSSSAQTFKRWLAVCASVSVAVGGYWLIF